VVPSTETLKVGGFGTTPRGIRFSIPLPSLPATLSLPYNSHTV